MDDFLNLIAFGLAALISGELARRLSLSFYCAILSFIAWRGSGLDYYFLFLGFFAIFIPTAYISGIKRSIAAA